MKQMFTMCNFIIKFQRENFTSPNSSNKLYTQLTISSKTQYGPNVKDIKVPATKKRRSSTSDKPSDINTDCKKGKVVEPFDLYNRNNLPHASKDNGPVEVEKRCDKNETVNANGKGTVLPQVSFCIIFLFSFTMLLAPDIGVPSAKIFPK